MPENSAGNRSTWIITLVVALMLFTRLSLAPSVVFGQEQGGAELVKQAYETLVNPESTPVVRGIAARDLYRRHVLPSGPGGDTLPLRYLTLPSTSPANAALGVAEKCRRWAVVREAAAAGKPPPP